MAKEEEWEELKGMPLWMPEETGEAIQGTIVKIEDDEERGRQYTIRTDKGEIRLPSHKVLQNRLSDCKIDDDIKAVYQGEQPPSKRGYSPTRMYDVFKKR